MHVDVERSGLSAERPRAHNCAVLNRREFLAAAGALAASAMCRAPAAGMGLPAPMPAQAGRERLERIGIQLYAVRDEMRRDPEDTLRRLAAIGYREVEFAGYHGLDPVRMRAVLGRHGLTAPSTHIAYDLIASGWERALDDAVARGHRFVIIPWLPPDARRSAAAWRALAEQFNRAGDAARARGLRFAYHNHDFELERVEGVVPLDLLLEQTDPALVSFQLDVYWVVKGGGRPLDYLERFPRRFSTLHIKDSAGPPGHRQVDVGAGVIDFAAVLRRDADHGRAVQHVFIEHDQPADAMAFARASFDYLSRLEY